jgi:hypothetical protein
MLKFQRAAGFPAIFLLFAIIQSQGRSLGNASIREKP